MDGDNGYSPYDPFDPLCSPFDDYCGTDIGGPINVNLPAPIVIIVNGTSAELGSVQNAVNNLVTLSKAIVTILGLVYQAIAAIIALLKLLWDNWLKDLWQKLKDALAKLQRILDKILKPIRDALKAQRDAIMDIYKRFIRPLIVFLESIRRFIAILKIFHIHLLDKLDAQLAALERRIMEPFLRALGRVNTIGNWINFILNTKLLIFRNLYLGSMKANKFGAFNMLAGAPAFGMPLLPPAPTDTTKPPDQPMTYARAVSALNDAIPQIAAHFAGTPTADLVLCWKQPVEMPDLKGATEDLLSCLLTL